MKRIILPMDFSSVALNALHYAMAMTQGEKTNILLVHALDYPQPHRSEYFMATDRKLTIQSCRYELEAEKKLIALSKRFSSAHIQFTRQISRGTLVHWVTHELRKIACDLIVIGTTSKTSGSDDLREPLIAKIIRHACCPVFTVSEEARWRSVRNVVVPYEPSELSERFFCSLKNTHVLNEATVQMLWINTPHTLERESDIIKKMTNFAGRNAIKDYRINIRRAFSHAAGVLSFIEEVSGDLVVMATHGRKGFEHPLLDSMTTEIVRRAKVPAWTYQAAIEKKGSLEPGMCNRIRDESLTRKIRRNAARDLFVTRLNL